MRTSAGPATGYPPRRPQSNSPGIFCDEEALMRELAPFALPVPAREFAPAPEATRRLDRVPEKAQNRDRTIPSSGKTAGNASDDLMRELAAYALPRQMNNLRRLGG